MMFCFVLENHTAWNMVSQLKFAQKVASRGTMAVTLAVVKEETSHSAQRCFVSLLKSHTAWNTKEVKVKGKGLVLLADTCLVWEMLATAPKVSRARASVRVPTQ